MSQYTGKRHKISKFVVCSQDTAKSSKFFVSYDTSLDVFLFRSTTCTKLCCKNLVTDFSHGCQIDTFGAKNQKRGSFEKQLTPKIVFGYLATFWLFCNFFIPQIFLGEELRVVRVAYPCYHKRRTGPHLSTQIYLKRDKEDVQVERATCLMQYPLNLFLLCTALF